MMDTNLHSNHRPTLDFTSMVFGFAAGILGTLVFATYKQRDFDRVLGKSRDMAGQTNEFFEDFGDNARQIGSNVAKAAHRGITSVDNSAHNAVSSLEKSMKD